MHIVQLELDNFKSFAHKTAIPFYEGLTVISGPNGVGKSNIIDAISFVLSDSLQEPADNLINTVTGKKYADVTLMFSDGSCIRRRVEQTQDGVSSQCWINHSSINSPEEILAFLAKIGSWPEAHPVVTHEWFDRFVVKRRRNRMESIDWILSVLQSDQLSFRVFDEVDGPLDDSAAEHLAEKVRAISENSQFLIVSRRKMMIDAADRLMEVTAVPHESTLITSIKKVNEQA